MNDVLLFLIACGALLGAADDMTGRRLGLGGLFEEGFLCMGQTALSMVGIICVIPVVGRVLAPLFTALAAFFRFDPAMFGALLANNMGGYPLAMQLAQEEPMGRFAGLVVASTLGATLVYTIPVGLSMLGKERHKAFARGVLLGLIPIPAGALAGGRMMGLSWGTCMRNLLPVAAAALCIIWGFWRGERRLFAFFMRFSRILNGVALGSLALAAFPYICGVELLPGMGDIMEGMTVVADMGIIQLGSIPAAVLFSRLMRRPLRWLSLKTGISPEAMAALPITCVNAISSFAMMKTMDEEGIVVASAFLTSSICVFTAHLSYTLAEAKELLAPVMAAKLLSGFLALLLAVGAQRNKKRRMTAPGFENR